MKTMASMNHICKTQKSLIFYCSELGQLCIRNYNKEWMPKSRAFELVWKRYDESHYYKSMSDHDVTSFEPDVVNETKKLLPSSYLSEVVAKVEKILTNDSEIDENNENHDESVDKHVNQLLSLAQNKRQNEPNEQNQQKNSKLTELNKNIIHQVIRTEVGKSSEKSTLQIFEEKFPEQKLRTDCFFVKRSLKFGMSDKDFKSFCRNDLWGTNIFLGGKTDAILDKSKIPLEVKMRQYKLLNEVPAHEKLQCLGYCFLTNQDECIWVQRFGKDIDVQKILFSERVFEKVALILCRYSELLAVMLLDESWNHEYCKVMKSEEKRSEFIDNFIFGHLKKGMIQKENEGARIFI